MFRAGVMAYLEKERAEFVAILRELGLLKAQQPI